MISIRKPASLIFLLYVLFLFSACNNEVKNTVKPNIIVFLVDDLGWNDTSLPLSGEATKYNQRYRTPNLEKLADRGMVFTHAYSNAICVPSRVSLLTGQNFMRHQVKGDIIPQVNKRKTLHFPPARVIDKPENMLPAVLSRNGYKTIISGKYHACHRCPADKSPTPEAAGFDINIGGTGYGAPANYYAADSFQIDGSNRPMPNLEEYFGKDVHLTEALTEKALGAAEQSMQEGKPFFLYLAHYAVHTPIQAHNPYMKNYTAEDGEPLDEIEYASMIEGVDVSLGKVMDFLKNKDIDDNTLLIFYSDNGGRVLLRGKKSLYDDYEFNYPLRSGKASLYQGGIRVPAVVKWPGSNNGKSKSVAPTMIEDIYSTALDVAGLELPEPNLTDGMSWVSLRKNPNDKSFIDRKQYFLMPYRFDGVAFNGEDFADGGVAASASLIEGDFKLLFFFEKKRFELYNIAKDPSEENNLIEIELDKADEMIRDLDANMKEKNITILPVRLPDSTNVEWPLEVWRGIEL